MGCLSKPLKCVINRLPISTGIEGDDDIFTMNTHEDESSSGLNARLRPRKSTNSQSDRISRKTDGKNHQDKPKRTNTPSKVTSIKADDLSEKSDLSSPPLLLLCTYCDKKFASKSAISKHVRRIHLSNSKQDTSITCLFCHYAVSDPCNIIRHMVDNHPNQYFACLDCHTRFPSTAALAEHKLNVCEKHKIPYRSKLRQNVSNSKKIQSAHMEEDFRKENKDYVDHRFNGIVISCELKPAQISDGADIEDNITTNLILPPNKGLGASAIIEKNAVILLDDIQWSKRMPTNFSFHNTDADQILSRLGVVHRSPRTGESTKKDWIKSSEDINYKFEKCFDTGFYSKVASNVQENLSKFLDGSFNFNPDANNTIKTRKLKNSVVINTAEGFPVLLAYEQYSRQTFDGYMPRTIAPKHKWKWENEKSSIHPDDIKRDSHANNCIITLVASLDIWTQLCMRRKFEDKFKIAPLEKKSDKQNLINKELKEILESRELPSSSSQVVKYSANFEYPEESLDFPASLGLTPSQPRYEFQPAVLSGEWVRPRCYVCCACGAQSRDSRGLSSHVSTYHPNAHVQHYEIVGELLLNADILKYLYVPPSQPANRTRPLRGIKECTKCKKSTSLEELHQHMLDCAGDTPTVRRKCRYRPFGVRRRRPRLPDNTIRKKIRKDLRRQTRQSRQKCHLRSRAKIRSEVGDAETIRKMLADLPAKRHRVMVNTAHPSLRPRRVINKQRNKLILKKRIPDNSKYHQQQDTFRNVNDFEVPGLCDDKTDCAEDADDEDDRKGLNKPNDDSDGQNTKIKSNICQGNPEDFKPNAKQILSKRNESFTRKVTPRRLRRKTHLREEKAKLSHNSEQPPQPPHPSLPPPPSPPPSQPPSISSSLSAISIKSPNNIELQQSPIEISPQKIDLNNSPYKTREHGGRNQSDNNYNNNNNNSNNNNGCSSNNNNNNSNSPQPGNSGQDGDMQNPFTPIQNIPLKHSIAQLTADPSTQDETLQYHHMFLLQQEESGTEHAPTGVQPLFENEEAVLRLDKPPLITPPISSIESQRIKQQKCKRNLDACINLLKNKLEPKNPSRFEYEDSQTTEQKRHRHNDSMNPNNIPEFNGMYPIPNQSAELHHFHQQNHQPNDRMIQERLYEIQKVNSIQREFQNLSQYNRQLQFPLPYSVNTMGINIDIQNPATLTENKRHSSRRRAPRCDKDVQREKYNLPPSIDLIPFTSPPNVNDIPMPHLSTSRQNSRCSRNTMKYKTSQSKKSTVKEYQPQSVPNLPTYEQHVNHNLLHMNPMDMLVPRPFNNMPIIECNRPEVNVPQLSECNIYVGNNFTKNIPATIIPEREPSRNEALEKSLKTNSTQLSNTSTSIMHTNQKSLNPIMTKPWEVTYLACSTSSASDEYEPLDTSNKEVNAIDLSLKKSTQPSHYQVQVEENNMDKHNDDIGKANDSTNLKEVILPTDLSVKNAYKACHKYVHNHSNINKCFEEEAHATKELDQVTPTISQNNIIEPVVMPLVKIFTDNHESSVEMFGLRVKNPENKISEHNLAEQYNIQEKAATSNDGLYLEKNVCYQDIYEKTEILQINSQAQPKHSDTVSHSGCPSLLSKQASETSSQIFLSSDACGNEAQPIVSVDNSQCLLNSQPMAENKYCASELGNMESEKGNDTIVPKTFCSLAPMYNGMPIYTLSNPLPTYKSKHESTTPVYTLTTACISMTKIEPSVITSKSDTLLSIPSTTIASAIPVYTLTDTTIGASPSNLPSMNYNSHRSSSPPVNNINSQPDLDICTEKTNIHSTDEMLDSEMAKKISMLPKELVEILGTMPVSHRNQLLNILPQYVSKSPITTLQEKECKSDTDNAMVSEHADSKPQLNCSNTAELSSTKEDKDITLKKITSETGNNSIIDLTDDDIDKDISLRKSEEQFNITATCIEVPNVRTNKKNDQTASLRAVRIKTPSERKMSACSETQILKTQDPTNKIPDTCLNVMIDTDVQSEFSVSTVKQPTVISTQHNVKDTIDDISRKCMQSSSVQTIKNTCQPDDTPDLLIATRQKDPNTSAAIHVSCSFVETIVNTDELKDSISQELSVPITPSNSIALETGASLSFNEASQTNTLDFARNTTTKYANALDEDSEDDVSLATIVKQKILEQNKKDETQHKIKRKRKDSKRNNIPEKNVSQNTAKSGSDVLNITNNQFSSLISHQPLMTSYSENTEDNVNKVAAVNNNTTYSYSQQDQKETKKRTSSKNEFDNAETVNPVYKNLLNEEDNSIIDESKDKCFFNSINEQIHDKLNTVKTDKEMKNNKQLRIYLCKSTAQKNICTPKDEVLKIDDNIVVSKEAINITNIGTNELSTSIPESEEINIRHDESHDITCKNDVKNNEDVALESTSIDSALTPLRRSRRGKSLFLEKASTETSNLNCPEVIHEHKTPLTKKQLIFTKMLLDEQNPVLPAHITPRGNDINACKDSSKNIEVEKLVTSEKNKPCKRRFSPNGVKRTKKKKFTPDIQEKKVEAYIVCGGDGSQSSNNLIIKSKTLEIEKQSIVTGNTENECFTNNVNLNECVTLPEEQPSIADEHEIIEEKPGLISVDKRKLLCEISPDIKSKKAKSLKEETQEQSLNDIESNSSSHADKTESTKINANRTACYNLPVSTKRARSKSIVIKTSENDFYDPYDINLDDMIDQCEIVKDVKSGHKVSNCKGKLIDCKKQTENEQATQNLSNLKEIQDQPVISDSDSSKSDIPLKKYVEEKETLEHESPTFNDIVHDCKSRSFNQSNSVTLNNPANEEEQELRSEQFMESFGFFSERKPRKSNLLASKKIAETFNINNESDDMYFGFKEKSLKKGLQSESKKKIEKDTTTIDQQIVSPKKSVKRGKKKAIAKKPERAASLPNESGGYNDVDYIKRQEIKKIDAAVQPIYSDSISDSKDVASCSRESNLKENQTAYQTAYQSEPKDIPDNLLSPNTSSNQEVDDHSNTEKPKNSKVKKSSISVEVLPVKEKMYPDVIDDIDMFEDKFDKIKRKCRSQAAAAKQIQPVTEPSVSSKARKRTDKKKCNKRSKKTRHQSTQVPTKGALKGFDGVKSVTTPDTNMPSPGPETENTQKKKKNSSTKKRRENNELESSKRDSDNHHKDDASTNTNKIDVYEFMDNEESELFEFRPTTLMERFRSISTKDSPNSSRLSSVPINNSSESGSDGDDFVYMSDDYVCSDDETENSVLSLENTNVKTSNETRKNTHAHKRKDVIEKNAVMGKIFKNNAVRAEKKISHTKDTSKPKSNLDQLFDSLLEPSTSMSSNEITPFESRDKCFLKKDATLATKYDSSSTKLFEKADDNRLSTSFLTSLSSEKCEEFAFSPSEGYSILHKSDDLLNRYEVKEKDLYKPSTYKNHDDSNDISYIDNGPSTSKAFDIQVQHEAKHSSPKRKVYPKEAMTTKHCESEVQKQVEEISPPNSCDALDYYVKSKSPDRKADEGISTSFDTLIEYNNDNKSADEAGVARQRARRKCTVGKQNILAESWSSESEADGGPQRPNSASSDIATAVRKRKNKKKETQQAGSKRGASRQGTCKKIDVESRLSDRNSSGIGCNVSANVSGRPYGGVEDPGEGTSAGPSERAEADAAAAMPAPAAAAPAHAHRAKRPAASWADADEPDHQPQHGWIVGDSHKKLVTMLAHAKGRKRHNEDKRHSKE